MLSTHALHTHVHTTRFSALVYTCICHIHRTFTHTQAHRHTPHTHTGHSYTHTQAHRYTPHTHSLTRHLNTHRHTTTHHTHTLSQDSHIHTGTPPQTTHTCTHKTHKTFIHTHRHTATHHTHTLTNTCSPRHMSRHTTLAHAHTGTHVLTSIDVCATQCTGPARAHTLPTEAQRSPTTCPPLESTHGLWISSGKESVPSHTGPWSREARVPRQEDTSRPGTVRPWSPGMLAVPWAGPLQPWLTLSPTRHPLSASHEVC